MSYKFKQETGMTLTEYILKEKTEEAKRLLRYSDKPINAISAYLGFSSQSHFSSVFKKYTNCLPNDYRKKHSDMYRAPAFDPSQKPSTHEKES